MTETDKIGFVVGWNSVIPDVSTAKVLKQGLSG